MVTRGDFSEVFSFPKCPLHLKDKRMCSECCDQYNIFPSVVIGGTTGDYEIECPVQSCKWAEYRILHIANATTADAQVVVSGDTPPIALPYTGTLKTLTDNTFIRGEAYYCIYEQTTRGAQQWQRITHSQRRVFVRIDNGGVSATYVTLQFRVRVLTNIPGPIEAVPHPDLGQQINIAREKRINDRLVKAGIPERFH